jgi:RHH-type transcriptional regulator, proline utilization regulon repressor / proline dehydrogenase / delta 1-pyrroline-5-carboxylate dehydrogenase
VPEHVTDDSQRLNASVALARRWLDVASADKRGRRQRERMGRAVASDETLALSVLLADTVMRVPGAERSANLFVDSTVKRGVPSGLSVIDRTLIRAGAAVAPVIPGIVMGAVRRRVHHEASGTIGDADPAKLGKRVTTRRAEGFGLNVNVLGEAILGNDEAQRRFESVSEMMGRTDVDYVSVKISSLVTQLDPMAFDDSVDRIVNRLVDLYRRSQSTGTFVNLDMEEYRDLDLTIAAFLRALGSEQFLELRAGIVLQAYLPDSHRALEQLGAWSADRVAKGGAPIKIRLVKGANLAMETVEAELHGWQAAPYPDKAAVDASYKRLLDQALTWAAKGSINIGVASHNLFDLAWAVTLASERHASDRVEIEMLEGMAPAEARSIVADQIAVRLYTPVCTEQERVAATAYLVRRLDENGTPGNFLRDAFTMTSGSASFADQERRFRAAVAARHTISTERRRGPETLGADREFHNEPDGDMVLPEVRRAAAEAINQYCEATPVAITFDGHVSSLAHAAHRSDSNDTVSWHDPSAPDMMRFRIGMAQKSDVDAAVARAVSALSTWFAQGAKSRAELLNRSAEVMASQRLSTIALMAVDCAKTVAEGDPEVSEAIDFARYYARSAVQLHQQIQQASGRPLGVVVVIPPWNFPYAITAGGILAALAAGNTVICKPAPEAFRVGLRVCEQLWEAGVPRDVLQFLACPDNEVGQRLVTHPDVAAVILTGSYETAELFTGWKPELRLFAETSGKNALIITEAADIDAAVADLIRSAFGHAGQKCSAASLAIVEAAVYDSDTFRRQLRDAVTSLRVGPAWAPTTRVGPVISPPGPALRRALTTLDDGEFWLVEPVVDPLNDRLWSPGVKFGVQPGSWSHLNEWFGPVLGVMRAPNLDTAISWANATPYGLTAGISSLDGDECSTFVERIQAGNVYVNRGTTGAIVERQPFGGWKRSSVGAGTKAGGPNYLLALQSWTPCRASVQDAAASYARWWSDEFGASKDRAGLAAERNVSRYVPLPRVILRVDRTTDPSMIEMAKLAATTCDTPISISSSEDETDAELAQRLEARAKTRTVGGSNVRLRLLCDASPELRLVASRTGTVVDDTPVTADGRIELVHWIREQAISVTSHRHGSRLGAPVIKLPGD